MSYDLTKPLSKVEESIIVCGDSLEKMKLLPDKCCHLVFTSPPYAGLLRKYVDDPRDLGQLKTDEYVEKFIDYVKEIERILRHEEGCVFILNLGEKYENGFASNYIEKLMFDIIEQTSFRVIDKVPWIKCLSSDTSLYVKTKTYEGPMKIKDLVRLKPQDIKIWDGSKWNQAHGWQKSDSTTGLKITFKNGYSVSVTEDHKMILNDENEIIAKDVKIGNKMLSGKTPEPTDKFGDILSDELGWLIGLYLAEGSKISGKYGIRFSLHENEIEYQNKILEIGKKINAEGSVQKNKFDHGVEVRLYGEHIEGLINHFVNGDSSETKNLSYYTWKMRNSFIDKILRGYLNGDGIKKNKNSNYYGIGFCRNYALKDSLMFMAARLGYYCKIEPSFSVCQSGKFPSFKGYINLVKNNLDEGFEVANIQRSKARNFWDISLEKDPHRLSLSCGLIVKNCDPMPGKESRHGCIAWEHVMIFGSQSDKLNKNEDFLKRPYSTSRMVMAMKRDIKVTRKQTGHKINEARSFNHFGASPLNWILCSTQGVSGSNHMAQMPEELATYFVGGYSREGQVVMDPFGGGGTTAAVAWSLNREFITIDLSEENCKKIENRIAGIGKRVQEFNFFGLNNAPPELQEIKEQCQLKDTSQEQQNIFSFDSEKSK